jgi:isopenicillin-N N-acyltransferase like protein
MKQPANPSIFPVLLLLLWSLAAAGCSALPENRLPLQQRSVVIEDAAAAQAILARASLETVSAPGATSVRVLHLQGTPYEMGFQHGVLLRDDIQALYRQTLRRVKLLMAEEMLDEAYDLMAPYIPREEQEEMRGLAHGADVPLRAVHWIHSIPEISEYGQKKRFTRGFTATSCSNLVAFDQATADGALYHLRVLDWARDLGIQRWPAILLHRPNQGQASVTFGYAGFIGAVVGMNAQALTFGEMGYGNPPGESLEGIPFIFLFRQLMREAASLEQARQIITDAVRTNSYVYVIGDAKPQQQEERGLLFITDRGRVLSYGENTLIQDERPKGDTFLPIDDVVYGGAKGEILHQEILRHYGALGPATLMALTKPVALNSNLLNVILKPATLEAWVANATDEDGEGGKAAHQPWLHFDFAAALGR